MNVMMAAVRKAGRSLSKDFGEVEQLQVSVKGPGNFVSKADLRAEDILHAELSKAREGYSFLMEERGSVPGPDKTHVWVVDPLDGTTNFLHGIPFFAVSLALVREGEVVAGIVHNPIMDETFTAEKGKGAFLNDKRIRVAGRKILADAVIATGVPHRGWGDRVRYLEECRKIASEVSGMRSTGSAALDLCFTAAGRFDGYWQRDLAAWDIAAGLIMVTEAGGFLSDGDGKQKMLDTGSVIAGNQNMLKLLMAYTVPKPA